MSFLRFRSACVLSIPSITLVALPFPGLLAISGCDSNPEGPRVPSQYQSEAGKPAPDNPPLPRQGRDNPRGLQYAKPD
jgi:hypothetical protein